MIASLNGKDGERKRGEKKTSRERECHSRRFEDRVERWILSDKTLERRNDTKEQQTHQIGRRVIADGDETTRDHPAIGDWTSHSRLATIKFSTPDLSALHFKMEYFRLSRLGTACRGWSLLQPNPS